ncbi:MAG: DUF6876 family protein [Cyanobacteria bacterium J06623_1]
MSQKVNAAALPSRQFKGTAMTITHQDLRQFTGTETYYRHSLARNYLYTDGVQYLAEKAGAYWLVDAIVFNQMEKPFSNNPALAAFQCWTLKVTEGSRATLTCDDGNKNIVFTQQIPFTDFSLKEISLWLENKVLLLPSEH